MGGRRLWVRLAARFAVVVTAASALTAVRPAEAAESVPTPVISPTPRQLSVHGDGFPVPAVAGLVAAPNSARGVLAAAEQALRAAGVRRVERGATRHPLTVWITPPGTRGTAAGVLRRLAPGRAAPAGLPAEGYVLASGRVHGRGHIVLAGADPAGSAYAAQTLRQLVTPRGVPEVRIRDWPGMRWRGIVEGFYGRPWSHSDRLRMLGFSAARKMNTYVYAPKDDPYHRERWREPYPSGRLAELGELARTARARHVEFVFAVSPGSSVCYSSDTDFAALVAKNDALWRRGVRAFALFFDDIGGGFHCPQDTARFGGDPAPEAAAQAYLLNRFRREFVAARPGSRPLLTVPTEYTGTGDSPYRDRLAALLDRDVVVHWTGPDVVSKEITAEQAARAGEVFGHDLALWDNYPVNDFDPRRLFLGPLTGRAPTLADHGVIGLTANPMVQAEPSTISLATVADYTWNPAGYDPGRSWRQALTEIGGPARAALEVFAENSRSSGLDPRESVELSRLIGDFWRDRDAGSPGSGAGRLARYFDAMAAAQGRIRQAHPVFAGQAEPWLTRLRWYGTAGGAAVRSLVAERNGDATTAWRQRVVADRAARTAAGIDALIAAGAMEPFLARARAEGRTVEVTAPADGTSVPAGSDVAVSARVRAGRVPIARVEFLAGPHPVGTDTTAPYEVAWKDAPTGLHLLRARAVGGDGSVVETAPVRLTVGEPKPALLVVGTAEPLSVGDAAVRDRLEYLGHPVSVRTAARATPGDAEAAAAVVVTSTVASGDVGTKFRDVAVPVITWESFVFDDLGMAGDPGETFRMNQVHIAAPGSPLAAGLSGAVRVYRGENRLRWGTPAPSADTAATAGDEHGQATLFGYERGAPMIGLTAPARRLALFLGDDAIDPGVVTAEGLRLFDAGVVWATGVGTTANTPGRGDRSPVPTRGLSGTMGR